MSSPSGLAVVGRVAPGCLRSNAGLAPLHNGCPDASGGGHAAFHADAGAFVAHASLRASPCRVSLVAAEVTRRSNSFAKKSASLRRRLRHRGGKTFSATGRQDAG